MHCLQQCVFSGGVNIHVFCYDVLINYELLYQCLFGIYLSNKAVQFLSINSSAKDW